MQESPSSRRAWIEIEGDFDNFIKDMVALLAEGVDRNITTPFRALKNNTSPSSRRAWIEILNIRWLWKPSTVALLAEGVDRNMMIWN